MSTEFPKDFAYRNARRLLHLQRLSLSCTSNYGPIRPTTPRARFAHLNTWRNKKARREAGLYRQFMIS
jgi:hypothetical protein